MANNAPKYFTKSNFLWLISFSIRVLLAERSFSFFSGLHNKILNHELNIMADISSGWFATDLGEQSEGQGK